MELSNFGQDRPSQGGGRGTRTEIQASGEGGTGSGSFPMTNFSRAPAANQNPGRPPAASAPGNSNN